MKIILVLSAACVILSLAWINPQQDDAASVKRGKALYETYCLTCHQDDGAGVPKMNPPLIKTSYVSGDKKKLVTWVLSGTTDKIEIDGKYYSNNMPAQDYLKDQEIADVLTYIRKSFGNNYSAITAADVKNIRAAK